MSGHNRTHARIQLPGRADAAHAAPNPARLWLAVKHPTADQRLARANLGRQEEPRVPARLELDGVAAEPPPKAGTGGGEALGSPLRAALRRWAAA